jgi:hypothetical protein
LAEEEKVSPYGEIGVTGLKRSGGYVQDEFLRELHGRKGMETLREMANNDATVGAFLFAVNMLCRRVTWSVAAASDDQPDAEAASFLQSCLGDMSHSWEDFITDVLSMLPYGFAPHEIVYKQRQGANNNPTKRSKYNDGMIGWRKLAVRSQESLERWQFDDHGGLTGMWQLPPPDYKRRQHYYQAIEMQNASIEAENLRTKARNESRLAPTP